MRSNRTNSHRPKHKAGREREMREQEASTSRRRRLQYYNGNIKYSVILSIYSLNSLTFAREQIAVENLMFEYRAALCGIVRCVVGSRRRAYMKLSVLRICGMNQSKIYIVTKLEIEENILRMRRHFSRSYILIMLNARDQREPATSNDDNNNDDKCLLFVCFVRLAGLTIYACDALPVDTLLDDPDGTINCPHTMRCYQHV